MRSAGAMIAYQRRVDGVIAQISDDEALREALGYREGLLWIDLQIRGENDASILRELFHFHPLTIEDCVSEQVDPAKIDDHGDYIFVIVQALPLYEAGQEIEPLEVDFYLGSNYVV